MPTIFTVIATAITLFSFCTIVADVLPTSFDVYPYFEEQYPQRKVWRNLLPPVRLNNSALNACVRANEFYAPSMLRYPRSSSLMMGICDTLEIKVQFINRTDSSIVLIGENPHEWFAPRLYKTTMNIVSDAPVIDSTKLSYSVQACVDSLDPFNPQDTILPGNQSHVIAYNVWGLPEGVWVLALGTTSKTPGYLNVLYDGGVFEYRSPEDGQDTVNAWLALAERQKRCRDYSGALSWIEKVITVYPQSVPGWWSKANLHMWHGDSLLTFQAYDSAFKFFNNLTDPLLPDTTESVEPVERFYMRAVGPLMEFDYFIAQRDGFWK